MLAAHPDDIESWCAGTLALAVDAGARVELLIATSGEAGGSVAPTPALAAVRESEAKAAARVLGVGAPRFLRLRDGELEAGPALMDACTDFIREHRADLVLTFDPARP